MQTKERTWDSNRGGRDQWVTWLASIMQEARRVLKPGGHAFIWALPRTAHWTALALEQSGFEIREKHYHLFGSGMPKSHDISQAIDRLAHVERKIIGYHDARGTYDEHKRGKEGISQGIFHRKKFGEIAVTKPATPEATHWEGWGTATKPAVEEWILARAPLLENTIAAQVLATGTGAINIGACRVPESGRWPANLTLSHNLTCQPDKCTESCPIAELERQSAQIGPLGGASRYFRQFYYCPKASQSERTAHHTRENTHCTVKPLKLMRYLVKLITPPGGLCLDMFAGSGTTGLACIAEGFDYLLIKQLPEYVEIIRARIAHAEKEKRLHT